MVEILTSLKLALWAEYQMMLANASPVNDFAVILCLN